VVLGAGVPPPEPVVEPLLVDGVVLAVLVVCVAAPVVWASAGGVVADTVFVWEPQPPSRTPLERPTASAPLMLGFITPMVFAARAVALLY
jgi:hypothetical protein